MPTEPLLRDHIAVVTGASSGIGRSIAVTLAGQGAHVWLAARRADALQEVAGAIQAGGGSACAFPLDWTREEDARALAARLESAHAGLDVLVLCGGVMTHAPLEQASLDHLDLHYHSNLRGPYALAQALLPLLRRREGQIVFINSSAALRSGATTGQYAAMQHALRAVADGLRDEVNADGIRVLSVYPGRTATPRMAALYEKEGRPYHPELLMQPEDVASMVAHALALPRTAEVTDLHMRPMRKSY